MLEVQNQTDFDASDSEIIEHLANVFISDRFDRLRFYDQTTFNLQVGNIVIDVFRPIENWIDAFLFEQNARMMKFNTKRPLIGLFSESVPKFV